MEPNSIDPVSVDVDEAGHLLEFTTKFVREYSRMADVGACDTTGGMEFRRVFAEAQSQLFWPLLHSPTRRQPTVGEIREFIYLGANVSHVMDVSKTDTAQQYLERLEAVVHEVLNERVFTRRQGLALHVDPWDSRAATVEVQPHNGNHGSVWMDMEYDGDVYSKSLPRQPEVAVGVLLNELNLG